MSDQEEKVLSFVGDTLEHEFPVQFDAVIMNPPFQSTTRGKRQGGWGNKTLWDKFVQQALDKWLTPGGFLLAIHPSPWRKPLHPLWTVLSKHHHILSLSLHTEQDGREMFGCSTRYDWYLLQKGLSAARLRTSNQDTTTQVRGEDGQVQRLDLSNWDWLPNRMFPTIAQLFDFTGSRPTFEDVLFSRSAYGSDKSHMSKQETAEHCYPCIHSMNRQGISLLWSSDTAGGHFGIPKVILSVGRYPYPFNDYLGEYGMTQICCGLPISSQEEGDSLVSAFQHPVFQQVLKAIKWCTFYMDWRVFYWLRRDFAQLLGKG